VCDMHDIKHTVSHGIDYLLNKIEESVGSISLSSTKSSEYIMPPRECVLKLIEHNIKRGHSGHEENNVIAMELINAGWSDRDISFVFRSIYDEEAGDWGWYTDNISEAGRHIITLRAKAINRYSQDKLISLGVCNKECRCS